MLQLHRYLVNSKALMILIDRQPLNLNYVKSLCNVQSIIYISSLQHVKLVHYYVVNNECLAARRAEIG